MINRTQGNNEESDLDYNLSMS